LHHKSGFRRDTKSLAWTFTGIENVSWCAQSFHRAVKLSAAPSGSRHTLAAGLEKIFSPGELHISPEAQEEIERKIGQSLARSGINKLRAQP